MCGGTIERERERETQTSLIKGPETLGLERHFYTFLEGSIKISFMVNLPFQKKTRILCTISNGNALLLLL